MWQWRKSQFALALLSWATSDLNPPLNHGNFCFLAPVDQGRRTRPSSPQCGPPALARTPGRSHSGQQSLPAAQRQPPSHHRRRLPPAALPAAILSCPVAAVPSSREQQPAPLVLPEVTPATRLLEKRRQQFEADERLDAAKTAYATQARAGGLEKCNTRLPLFVACNERNEGTSLHMWSPGSRHGPAPRGALSQSCSGCCYAARPPPSLDPPPWLSCCRRWRSGRARRR